MVYDIYDKNFADTLAKNKCLVVIKFYAHWCGPCVQTKFIYQRLADKYKDSVLFLQMDNDTNPVFAEKYKIESLPTILFFKNNEIVDTLQGFSEGYEQRLNDKIKKHA